MGIDLAYGLYMAEAEGYLDTHDGKVNRMVKDIEDSLRSGNGVSIDNDFCNQYNLEFDDLTSYDLSKIENVARKYGARRG